MPGVRPTMSAFEYATSCGVLCLCDKMKEETEYILYIPVLPVSTQMHVYVFSTETAKRR